MLNVRRFGQNQINKEEDIVMALRAAKPVIFDLDGTLVRTQQEFHAIAETAVLKRRGIQANPAEISKQFSGVHTLEVFRQLAPACDPHELLAEKWERMMRMALIRPIKQMSCAKAVVQCMYDRGIPLAIASASPLKWISLCTTLVGIWNYFNEFVSVDEVERGKPAPDVFLLAAQRLGYAPERCIAVEDGKAGVHAALAAGMQTYWLTEENEVIIGAQKIRSLKELI